MVNDSGTLKLDVSGNRAREWTINSNIDKNRANDKCKVYLFLPLCVCVCVRFMDQCLWVSLSRNYCIQLSENEALHACSAGGHPAGDSCGCGVSQDPTLLSCLPAAVCSCTHCQAACGLPPMLGDRCGAGGRSCPHPWLVHSRAGVLT